MDIVDLRFDPSCIPVLARWHHGEWSHLTPARTLDSRIEKMQALLLGDDVVPSMFVGKEGEEILGSATLLEIDMDTRTDLSPWLASVYVAPEHRKRGIGTALVKHVMRMARDAGFKCLYLFTPDQERFYQALGWSILSREPYRGIQVTVMRYNPNG